MMDILEERQKFLQEEIEEYEKVTPMTVDERRLVRKWVSDEETLFEW